MRCHASSSSVRRVGLRIVDRGEDGIGSRGASARRTPPRPCRAWRRTPAGSGAPEQAQALRPARAAPAGLWAPSSRTSPKRRAAISSSRPGQRASRSPATEAGLRDPSSGASRRAASARSASSNASATAALPAWWLPSRPMRTSRSTPSGERRSISSPSQPSLAQRWRDTAAAVRPGRAAPPAAGHALDDRPQAAAGRAGHGQVAALDDGRLLGADGAERVAEVALVIELHVGDGGHAERRARWWRPAGRPCPPRPAPGRRRRAASSAKAAAVSTSNSVGGPSSAATRSTAGSTRAIAAREARLGSAAARRWRSARGS